MVCNACGKNEATIHLTEILNNQMVEIHLCEGCAEQKGTDFNAQFSFNQLLASLAEVSGVKTERTAKAYCKECGMTYEEFCRTGRFGCANCYYAFEKLLLPLLKRIQRDLKHVGKIPSKASVRVKQTVTLRELQDQLHQCVQAEAYEEAARVRDQIRQLTEKFKKEGKKTKG